MSDLIKAALGQREAAVRGYRIAMNVASIEVLGAMMQLASDHPAYAILEDLNRVLESHEQKAPELIKP
jgi:hypothetical protein